jgi:hypothetical protein
MGASFVSIYDARLWGKMKNSPDETYLPAGSSIFLLRSGDKYDMSTRRVVHWGGNNRSIYKVDNKK